MRLINQSSLKVQLSNIEIKFIDFTLTNIFGSIDFNEIGNVICAGTEYSNQISQILVRNRFCNAPVLLNLERDPVDAGLAILKASVGSKAGTLFVSNINPKRDENKFTGLFKKK